MKLGYKNNRTIKAKKYLHLARMAQGTCNLCGERFSEEDVFRYETFYRNVLVPGYANGLGLPEKIKRRSLKLNVDHIIPTSAGGTSRLRNLQLVHKRCNTNKGNGII